MIRGGGNQLDAPGLEERLNKASRGVEKAEAEESHPVRYMFISVGFLFLYLLIIVVGVVIAYNAIADLVHSFRNPVRSTRYRNVDSYLPPAIIIFPNGNEFVACGHYYNNIVGSVLSLSELDLTRKNCTYEHASYTDPIDNSTEREALIFKGPTNVDDIEALFIHLKSTHTNNDFYTASYYVLPFWDQVITADSSGHTTSVVLAHYHGRVPTFALSANMRMWIKMALREIYFIDRPEPTREFKYEMSVVQYLGEMPKAAYPFFIFFEWKTNLIERSHQMYAMTPWGLAAALLGMILALGKTWSMLVGVHSRLLGVSRQVKKVHAARRKNRTPAPTGSSTTEEERLPMTDAL